MRDEGYIRQWGIYHLEKKHWIWDYWGHVFVFDNLVVAEAQLLASWEICIAKDYINSCREDILLIKEFKG